MVSISLTKDSVREEEFPESRQRDSSNAGELSGNLALSIKLKTMVSSCLINDSLIESRLSCTSDSTTTLDMLIQARDQNRWRNQTKLTEARE